MKKLLFVFNPNSGKGQIKNKLLEIIQIFSDAGFEVTVYPTKAPRDGYEYILNNAAGYNCVVCSGGDGTLNETVEAVLSLSGKKPPIGYIPSGTTNDFAVSLKIPKDMLQAARNITVGRRRKCDIGMLNGKTFNYVAAFGAFTKVSYETPQALKNVLGHPAYLLEGMKSLTDLKPYHIKIHTNDTDIEGSFIYGMVSNTRSVGGFRGVVPGDVNLRDGLFEVALVRELKNPLDFQQVIAAVLSQNYEKCSLIQSFKANEIYFESDEQISWTVDGEYGGTYDSVHIEVIHNAVEFIIRGKNEAQLKN